MQKDLYLYLVRATIADHVCAYYSKKNLSLNHMIAPTNKKSIYEPREIFFATMNHLQEPRQEQNFTTNVPATSRHNNRLLQEARIGESEQAANVDAFLFYSNDEVRLRSLSGGIVGADQASRSTHGNARKTRISFELHPSLFCEDLLLNRDSFFSDFDDVNNLEDAFKAMDNDPRVKAFVSRLLRGD